MILICNPLMINDVEHLFMPLLAICKSYFGETSVHVFCPYFNVIVWELDFQEIAPKNEGRTADLLTFSLRSYPASPLLNSVGQSKSQDNPVGVRSSHLMPTQPTVGTEIQT